MRTVVLPVRILMHSKLASLRHVDAFEACLFGFHDRQFTRDAHRFSTPVAETRSLDQSGPEDVSKQNSVHNGSSRLVPVRWYIKVISQRYVSAHSQIAAGKSMLLHL